MRHLTWIGLFFFMCSCKDHIAFQKQKEKIEALNNMQQTDVDFSNLSKEAGMRKAFLAYIEDEGLLLRAGRMPIVGADAIDFITTINDSLFTLTWKPQGGDISQSFDLGYTYGVYTMQMGDSLHKGTYVTVWKKQQDGQWKFVLDTGNEGIGE